jgi:uncharacterized membrane protein
MLCIINFIIPDSSLLDNHHLQKENKLDRKGEIIMQRLAAFIVLLIPGIGAAWGIKLMRDALFGVQASVFPVWLQFLFGLVILVLCVGFFAGFLYRRDQRNGKIPKDRFKRKN